MFDVEREKEQMYNAYVVSCVFLYPSFEAQPSHFKPER